MGPLEMAHTRHALVHLDRPASLGHPSAVKPHRVPPLFRCHRRQRHLTAPALPRPRAFPHSPLSAHTPYLFPLHRANTSPVAPLPQVLAVDLLNPSIESELRKHKLKTLVQQPRSFFMDVKCPGCFQIT